MARRGRQRGRRVDGILLLDKPLGITSNGALQQVKRLFNAAKAGHTGNLDPAAGGMLPICFGEATKLSAFLLDADKVYTGTVKLGVRTTSADAEGEVIETRPVENITEARVREVLERFVGPQQQVPPMHSAIKQNGQPLYKLAHQGIEVERKPRDIEIFSIELLRLEGDEFDIRVHCSKGTYIRTLAEDIGEALGCGAHLCALYRDAVGPFRDKEQLVTLETLTALAEEGRFAAMGSMLLSMGEALDDWPAVQLTENSAYYVRQGQPVQVPKAPTHGLVRLLDPEGEFIGVGHILDDGRVAPKRLLRQD